MGIKVVKEDMAKLEADVAQFILGLGQLAYHEEAAKNSLTWTLYEELLKICSDPESYALHQAVKVDQKELTADETTFTEDATDACPWAFEYPSWVEKETKSAWRKFWAIDYENIDVAQSAADFYILNGIVNKAFSVDYEDLSLPSEAEVEEAGKRLGISGEEIASRVVHLGEYAKSKPENALTELASEAELVYTKMVHELSENFRNYTHAACGGELRHHKAISSLSTVRKLAWTKWYFIFEKYGVESLLKMKELFLEFSGGGFGGEAWANAADILYMYETSQLSSDPFTNKSLFVDRVFNLEHNGGCFLNKLAWANKRVGREKPFDINFVYMKDHVLNAHASNPVDLNVLYGFASEGIQSLCTKYMDKLTDLGYPLYVSWGEQTAAPKAGSVYMKAKAPKKEIKPVIDWSEEEQVEAKPVKKSSTNSDVNKINKILEKMNE